MIKIEMKVKTDNDCDYASSEHLKELINEFDEGLNAINDNVKIHILMEEEN